MEADLSMTDLAELTGFAQSLLSAIENGNETGISHIIEIGKAIGVHPKELLDVPMEIKPRFKLSPKRNESKRITFRITKLYEESDFFNSPKFVRDIVQYFKDEYKAKVSSAAVALVMKRFADDGKLKFTFVGRQKQYFKKKK